MKVIGFVGSPRKNGNTGILVRQMLQYAAGAGAQSKIYYLNDLYIKDCQACGYCKTNGRCQQKDDMQQLYEAMHTADGIVIGAPIYMGLINGLSKIFIDRWTALHASVHTNRLPAGKKAALIFAQGYPQKDAYQSHIQTIEKIVRNLRLEIVDTLVAAGVTPADEDQTLMEQAARIGKQLAQQRSTE